MIRRAVLFMTGTDQLIHELRSTLGKMEMVLGGIGDAIVWTDVDGIIQWCNGSFDRLVGKEHLEALGRPLKKLLPLKPYGQTIWEDEDVVRRVRQGTGRASILCEIATDRDGRLLEITGQCLELGEKMSVVLILHDMSKRIRAEEMLKQTAAELGRSNTDLERFACVVSHDLQEPLRMVTAYLQLLRKRYHGKLDAKADQFIGFAVDGACRMRILINDLLAFARVGRQGMPFAPADCKIAVNQALHNLKELIEERHARITAGTLPVVNGDLQELTQLFQNLIENAIKFNAGAAPAIHLSASRSEGKWLVAVRDNGIGIGPQDQERIFEVFQRLHNREEFPGTGIGLAICKRIVEHHSGRIWVESSPGEGSNFLFTIPDTEMGRTDGDIGKSGSFR